MHGATRTRTRTTQAATGIRAAVWLEPGRAFIVHVGDGGDRTTLEVEVPLLAGDMPPVLAEVAHAVGDADRVLMLGPVDLSTAPEREIVAIGHRPDAIREERPGGPVDESYLRARLERLR